MTRHAEAKEAVDPILNLALKSGDKRRISQIYTIIGVYISNIEEDLPAAINYLAEILINIDDLHLAEAEDWIAKAIEADRRNGMMFDLGLDYALYAELFQRKGNQSRAKENLNKAIEILKACGADGWVEKYAKDLDELSDL
jgi:tetratricopeptide (TPR) repeat protein